MGNRVHDSLSHVDKVAFLASWPQAARLNSHTTRDPRVTAAYQAITLSVQHSTTFSTAAVYWNVAGSSWIGILPRHVHAQVQSYRYPGTE
jgi:hypothetical protein